MSRLMPSSEPEISTVGQPHRLAAALGWTQDQISFLLHPLADGKEPIYSMGDDTPPAFLSKMRRTLWDYCKQRFAQVTNPPIDPLREAHVMSLDTRVGADFIADSPILDAQQMCELLKASVKPQRIDVTFDSCEGTSGAQEALERIRDQARCTPEGAPS